MKKSNPVKSYDELMAAYEKAANAFHKSKPMTAKASAAGKRMDKAAEALEMWRANNA